MSRCWPWLAGLAAVVPFLPTLGAGFVWDDVLMFVDNPSYRGLGRPQLAWMFTTVHMVHYSPISWLTLGADYTLWGMAPRGYHLTSLLLHGVTAAVFALVARRLIRAAQVVASETAIRLGAALAALLFAVHPLRVESVVWVTERRDLVSGLFYLLAILSYLRWAEPAAAGERPARRWYALALVCFVLALLSKSMTVSLPVVLLILDVYPLRRLGGSRGWLGAGARSVLVEKIPFFAASLIAGVGAIVALVVSGNAAVLPRLTPAARVSVAVFELCHHLWKTAMPTWLSPLYELYPSRELFGPAFAGRLALVLLITAGAIALRARWPALLAVWASYVVILTPVLGTANNLQIAADRYTYLATLGWALLGGAGLTWTWDRRAQRPGAARAALPLVLVVVVGLGVYTWRYAGVWRGEEPLWTRALAVDPRASVAHYNLGVVRAREGRTDEAARHFAEAIRWRPTHAAAHSSLAQALTVLGRAGEAEGHARESIRLDPDDASFHNRLGLALMERGDLEGAIAAFKDAIRLEPELATAHANWGLALMRGRRPAEAIPHLDRALALAPDLKGAREARTAAEVTLIVDPTQGPRR